MRRKYLITGGAGFIGSHLAEHLLAEGAAVTVVDNLSTGRWENIATLEGRPGFGAIIADVMDATLMEALIRDHDAVFHLASAVGVKRIIERPVAAVETTFQGTEVVMRHCSRYRKPVLLTSTSEVYGRVNGMPFREEMDCVIGATEKRRWAYACAKALDEFLALAHYYETRLPVFVVRLFNTVGPRQTGQYGMVVPTFMRQALRGEPVTVYGDGEQRRCFCAVSDIVEALGRLIETPAAVAHVVNLGSDEETSINALAEKVKKLTGSSSPIRHIPYEEAYGPGFDDMARRVPDLSRARRLIGFKTSKSIDDILAEMQDFLKLHPDRS